MLDATSNWRPARRNSAMAQTSRASPLSLYRKPPYERQSNPGSQNMARHAISSPRSSEGQRCGLCSDPYRSLRSRRSYRKDRCWRISSRLAPPPICRAIPRLDSKILHQDRDTESRRYRLVLFRTLCFTRSDYRQLARGGYSFVPTPGSCPGIG